MSSVALREMQKNTGFGQASRVSLHTKLWGRGCSLPTALGSRSTVKSYAQPKHYQGLMHRAVARCLALITFSLLSSQGPSTGGTCQRDWAQGAMATTCSLDVRNKFSPGKVVQDLAQKWQQPQGSRNQPWLESVCPVFANSNKGDSSARLAGLHSESARCGACVPVWAPPIRGQDPAPRPQAAAWEGGPQEELQHSCSARHSLQINN